MTLTETLRRDILTGALPPGTLLSQTELAERFGVSRIPIRDALRQLAAEKLVTVVAGRGARVVKLGPAELAEVFDLRVLLESDILRRATARATAVDHGEAEHALRRSTLEAGRPGWQEGDWLFHATLYAPAARPRQLSLIRELRDTCILHVAHYDRLTSRTARWCADHQKIFDAFRAGDAASAADLLARHITAARDHLLPQMTD